MKQTKIFKIFLLVAVGFFLFVIAGAGRPKTTLAKEGDALAVRVLPNSEHYNPLTWYYQQGFKGTPTPLEVDGYRAIRDGRTVYVNVANIDDQGTPDRSDDSIYTNIYLISYNQEAALEIVSIFDQILAHWKFNSNLTEPGNCFGQNPGRRCLADSDCEEGDFCDSLKAQLARDTRRLGDIVDLRLKIAEYYNNNNSYPKLSSGTYLTGKTVSTWPSWGNEFTSVLGANLPVDPINELGDCGSGDYDERTCWNDQDKIFADPNPDNDIFELPAGSEAFLYSVSDNAQSYTACAYMESGFMVGEALGACYGSAYFSEPPEIDCADMVGIAGKEFVGYLKADDPDGDDFSFSLSGNSEDILSRNGFSFENNLISKEIIIRSDNPPAGVYDIEAVAFDDMVSISKTCRLTINSEAFIVYPISDKRQLVNKTVNVSIYANHSRGDYSGLVFDITSSDSRQLSCAPDIENDGRARCNISLESDTAQIITITVSAQTDSMVASPQEFIVEFYNNPPVLTPAICPETVRVGQNYSCDLRFSDPDGHALGSCLAVNLPPGFSFEPASSRTVCRLSGSSNQVGRFSADLRASDQYGAESQVNEMDISIVDYCGDGEKQSPNLEGRGGSSDDGYEDCDCGALVDGKTVCYYDDDDAGLLPVDEAYGVPTIEQSNQSWQYDCSTRCSSARGGYCDDNVAQTKYGEECDFGGDINCCQGCQWNTTGPTREIGPLSADRILSAGSSMSITLPAPPDWPLSRGFLSGSFDASVYLNDDSDRSGPAIVFAVDASYLASFDIDDLKRVVDNFLNKLYIVSNINHANVYVSSFAFGDCDGGPICNMFKEDVISGQDGLANFKDFTETREGLLNYLDALSVVDSMVYYGDTTYDGRSSSGAIYGLIKAGEILNACDSACGTAADPTCVPNPQCQGATDKYLIILSDGVDVDPESVDEAGALKADGIEIYSMVFTHTSRGVERMCRWSSDYDNSSDTYIYPCDSGHYSYGRLPVPPDFDPIAEADAIFDQIIEKVLDNVPTVINYSVDGASGILPGTSDRVYFPLNNISCDISGQTPCSTRTFNLRLTGLTTSAGTPSTARVRFNNFILDRLPLCGE